MGEKVQKNTVVVWEHPGLGVGWWGWGTSVPSVSWLTAGLACLLPKPRESWFENTYCKSHRGKSVTWVAIDIRLNPPTPSNLNLMGASVFDFGWSQMNSPWSVS